MIEPIRSAWKALPLPLGARRAATQVIWGGLERLTERQYRRRTRPAKAGSVKVAGFFSESHGIAASARRCADALDAMGVVIERVDLGVLDPLALIRRPERRFAPGGAWIFHVNPPELVVSLATIGVEAVRDAFLAGYWAWELPDAPALWKRRKALVDEVWTPSAFTAAALTSPGATPVRVAPHSMATRATQDRARSRALLGLALEKFIAVTLFDFRSSLARKNPLGAIDAFRQAFGDDEATLLVIKAQHGASAPVLRAELAAAAAASANTLYIDEIWSSKRADDLIAAADVLISLHRAEGFGLTLAEAMAAGTPVIATAWSGNLDFMTDYEGLIPAAKTPVVDAQTIYEGQFWAAPDTAHAAKVLQRLRTDASFRERLAAHGRALVSRRLGLEAYRASLGPAFWAAVR